ncbi:NAD(P)-binding protein [Hortaea werneckii]|nr:NAD(P)-binding protein [Hortaea werneckii]KAI7367622.1 NAD(P)-binding protein [Hortaea werneckii]
MNTARIFLTGATGFIGSYVLQDCLGAGYKVRVSVRREEQARSLKHQFASQAGELEFVVIPDISQQEAFGDSLSDVDYVLHIASPMPGKGEDFKTDYLRPAMDGTQAILSAARASNSVKRVIITSSVLANIPLGDMNATDLHVKGMWNRLTARWLHTTFTVNSKANFFQEDDSLNIKVDPDMEFPEGMAGDGPKYQASKILAHQAARAMIEKEKPAFPVITIHPVFVLGPTLLERSAKDIGGINAWFWGSLGADSAPFPPAMVDVRDVAEAHVRAIHAPVDKPMTEFLIDGQVTGWDTVADLVEKKYRQLSLNWKRPFPKGMEVDVTRAETTLGMKWRPIRDTFSDLIEQQLSYST